MVDSISGASPIKKGDTKVPVSGEHSNNTKNTASANKISGSIYGVVYGAKALPAGDGQTVSDGIAKINKTVHIEGKADYETDVKVEGEAEYKGEKEVSGETSARPKMDLGVIGKAATLGAISGIIKKLSSSFKPVETKTENSVHLSPEHTHSEYDNGTTLGMTVESKITTPEHTHSEYINGKPTGTIDNKD